MHIAHRFEVHGCAVGDVPFVLQQIKRLQSLPLHIHRSMTLTAQIMHVNRCLLGLAQKYRSQDQVFSMIDPLPKKTNDEAEIIVHIYL